MWTPITLFVIWVYITIIIVKKMCCLININLIKYKENISNMTKQTKLQSTSINNYFKVSSTK